MNKDGNLYSPEGGKVQEILLQRKKILTQGKENLDVLIVEFFPFGRYQFRHEILALIESSKKKSNQLKVFASMRDIYTLKNDVSKREKRARYTKDILNQHFDALLIHSDPSFIHLKESYPYYSDIEVPIHYTGFAVPSFVGNSQKNEREVVVSIGGGLWGQDLFEQVLDAALELQEYKFTFFAPILQGSYRVDNLPRNVRICVFDQYRFQSVLETATFSISLAGYNTVFECLKTKTTPILYPWTENNEQPLRAQLLAKKGISYTLGPHAKAKEQIIDILRNRGPLEYATQPNLSGATETCKIINYLKNS